MARVAALVPDLMFASKVDGMLRAAGHDVALCTSEPEAWSQAQGADVLVVDLAAEDVDGVTLVDSMRSGGELHDVRTLGFYPHVEAATRERAQRAGFDLVVPRSRMAREGAQLVAGLLEESA